MVDSRRDVAGQAGRSPSPSVQATMIGLMAILLWSLMTGWFAWSPMRSARRWDRR